MIRVLHSVSNMDRAGIETMLMNYYRHMDRNKVQFDFLCNKKKPGAYDEEIINMGGQIYHTPGLNPLNYSKYLKFMKTLFKENPKYKIIEAHNGALGVYALHAAKKNNIPVRIFHAHGASIAKDWKLPLKLFCKSRLPKNMTHHYTCGIAAAECYFGKKTVDKGDFVLVPNAIDVDRFVFNEESRNRIRKEYHLEDKKVIGHVGRFMKQKNHDFLIDLFEAVAKKDEKLQLVLLGDGELMQAIKDKVAEKGLDKKVTFVGNVGNANEWYSAFDLFILPSVWEGLPVVGVEAQAADLPCIFSDSITREIALTSNVAFIDLKDDKEKWVNAILSKICKHERIDQTQTITKNHYNINIEAINLQNRYLELYGES